jgi:adenylate cyclase
VSLKERIGMKPAYVLLADGTTRVELDQGTSWKVGRGDSNAIVIPDDLVSRNHALLQKSDTGGYILIDMGSRNGSFVNGVRVSIPASVKDGDTVTLGPYSFTFHEPLESASTQLAAAAHVEAEATKGFFAPRLTTVLVVDVRDFTKLTQAISEELLCQIIGTWFREGGQIMQQQGSWAQKYIGDALMAVWVHMKGPEQEVVEIMRALANLVKLTGTLQERYGLDHPVRIGAGLNSGLATVGNAGSREIGDYTALGDTVNAAFRIESSTKELGVDLALGQPTYDTLKKSSNPDPFFEERTVNLKGYEKPRPVWATTFARLEQYLLSLPVRTA